MRASRFFVAVGVMLVGLCAALPFRQVAPPPRVVPREVMPLALTLRQPDAPLELALRSEVSPAVGLESLVGANAPDRMAPGAANERTPDLRNIAPPPALPVSFQPLERPGPVDWRPEPAARPATAAVKPRRYRLRDGDTLERLAERFLGQRERAGEIFEANRDVLARPDLLPVGTTIVLPQRNSDNELEPVKAN